MLVFKKIKEDENEVIYKYYPENKNDFGILKYNKNTEEFVFDEKESTHKKKDSYFNRMRYRIRCFAEENDFKDEGMIMFY